MNRLAAFGAAALAALPVAARANDTMAELAAGGLTFVAADNVSMRSEDLYISPKEVRVDYVFHNDGREDRTALVAFPMPELAPVTMTIFPRISTFNFPSMAKSIAKCAVKSNIKTVCVARGKSNLSKTASDEYTY